jgi:hypothetical protein
MAKYMVDNAGVIRDKNTTIYTACIKEIQTGNTYSVGPAYTVHDLLEEVLIRFGK